MPDADVAVIGGGISGLTCAYYLKRRGLSVMVLEASKSVGGCIKTIRAGPYIAEGGPQSYSATREFTELVDDLGLSGRVRRSETTASKRYFFARDRLVAAPVSPRELVASPLLSAGGKLRLLGETLVRARRSGADESVAAFVRRRAGQEVLERIAVPIVSGIFAGDPAQLSVQSAFPALVRMEEEHGGLLRAAKAMTRAGAGAPRNDSVTFDEGNAVLPIALSERLGAALKLDAPVARLTRGGERYDLDCLGPARFRVSAARVVVATPADAAASLLAGVELEAADELRDIDSVPVAQIVMSYPCDAVRVPLDGFGFLAARGEGLRILGAVWTSVIFADRAPSGKVLVAAFIGGVFNRSVIGQSDAELAAIADEDLRRVMSIGQARPTVVAGFRWDRAIPQYAIGHAERVQRVETALARHPNLRLVGNYLRGISVADCIREARKAAESMSMANA